MLFCYKSFLEMSHKRLACEKYRLFGGNEEYDEAKTK